MHLSIGENIDNQIHSRFNINLQHRILILLSITQSFICLLHKESPDSFSNCIQMNATRSGIHIIAERIYPRLKRSRVCKRKLKRQTSLNSLFSTVILIKFGFTVEVFRLYQDRICQMRFQKITHITRLILGAGDDFVHTLLNGINDLTVGRDKIRNTIQPFFQVILIDDC